MGTSCDLTLLGGDDALLERAVARVEELEARWSRFRPTSELLRLHAHPGRPVVVSDDTFAVLELAVSAWRDTGGAFDPTVHDAVLAAGYTTDFASIPDDGGPVRAAPPAPGLDAVHLDPLVRAVTLPHGVHLDLGGIGKGRAADVVATELLAAGARGVCLSMGGDVRLAEDVALAVHFHLHPLVTAQADADGGALVRLRNGEGWRLSATGAKVLVEPSVHYADLSGPLRSSQIVLRAATFGVTDIHWRFERLD